MSDVNAYRRLMADVYELAGLSRRSSEAIAGRWGATAAQWHVLSAASESELSVAAIARRLGLARQSVHRVVGMLSGRGLVELIPNPDHRRSPLVRLTGSGRALLDRLWADSDQQRARLVRQAGLSIADLEQAQATLRSLADAFGVQDTERDDSAALDGDG